MARDHVGKTNRAWSAEELNATVAAYFDMLDCEARSEPYTKANINKRLRAGPLRARSKGAVEYKFGNISAVLRRAGLAWVPGYKPYPNVQRALQEGVLAEAEARNLLTSSDFEPTADRQVLQHRARKVRARHGLKKPKGTMKPATVVVNGGEVWKRDPAVVAWVLEQADGSCELCHSPAPFEDKFGEPFLEVHHVQHLAEEGADTPDNAVALCPNCHRRLHHSADRDDAKAELYAAVDRLIPE